MRIDEIRLTEETDRRVKLTKQDKKDILELKGKLIQARVAELYKVDKATIRFIWNPQALEENIQRRAERGGSKQYYDREYHNAKMREHREYKRKLQELGQI